MRWVDGIRAALWVAPVALLGGCGDDQSNNPPAQNAISKDLAVAASLAAAEFIDVFVSSIGHVMASDLTGGIGTLPSSWHPGELSRDGICSNEEPPCERQWTGTAWTASCASVSADCSITTWLFVQFSDEAGQPQQLPDASTREISHRIDRTVEFLAGNTRRPRELLDYAFDFTNEMSLEARPEQIYAANGAGGMQLRIDRNRGAETLDEVPASWTYDLLVPARGGCPTGTVEIVVGRCTTHVTYGSGGRYAVTVQFDGDVIHSREGVSGCT